MRLGMDLLVAATVCSLSAAAMPSAISINACEVVMPVPMHLSPLKVERVSLIYVLAMRGDGSAHNPAREIHRYYSDEGRLLACYDPINGPPDYFFSPPLNPD